MVSPDTSQDQVPVRVLVLCDFDGTASAIDVGHHLLKKFSNERWEKIDADYRNGVIGSMDAYRRIAEATVATQEEFFDHLQTLIQLDAGFPAFCTFCRKKGYSLKIVSDGLDYYIGKILKHYRLDHIPYFSNRLTFESAQAVAIDFPMSNPVCGRCGTCKKSILESCRNEFDRIIYIGDGYSDFCPSRFADLVFAKQILYQHNLRKGVPCIHFSNFSEIQDYMEKRCNEISGTLSDQTLGGG